MYYADRGSGNMLATGIQLIIASVVCSLVFSTLGILIGFLCYHWVVIRKSKNSSSCSSTPPATSAPIVHEDILPDSQSQGQNDIIELKDNAAYGPVLATNSS